MPKRVLPLSDIQVKNAKSAKADYKLSDGNGLYLLVTTTGGKLWRFKYRFNGKEKLMALGTYPEVTLAEARNRRDQARQLIANGVDPGELKKRLRSEKAEQTANTFEAVAREWHAKNYSSWVPAHGDQVLRRLELDVFPMIGNKPIADLDPADVLTPLQKIEMRGSRETAHRVKQTCGQVFRYAVATRRAQRDVTADLRGALAKVNSSNLGAITEPAKVAELLRAIDGFEGSFIVKCALQLAPLVFVRPGELRQAEWSEIDLDNATWEIPAAKMKMKKPHVVPLSVQAVNILQSIYPLTGSTRYVFPCHRSTARPMSNMALSAALRRLGYAQGEMTPHGFRALARTILDEVLQVRPDFIEHQLAHAVRDPNGRAYNRTAHLAERRKMMQLWADYLDRLKAGVGERGPADRGRA